MDSRLHWDEFSPHEQEQDKEFSRRAQRPNAAENKSAMASSKQIRRQILRQSPQPRLNLKLIPDSLHPRQTPNLCWKLS
jgi:hypothetical protein